MAGKFYWVFSGNGVWHVLPGPRVDGALTRCGVPISTAWSWVRPSFPGELPMHGCKKCARREI